MRLTMKNSSFLFLIVLTGKTSSPPIDPIKHGNVYSMTSPYYTPAIPLSSFCVSLRPIYIHLRAEKIWTEGHGQCISTLFARFLHAKYVLVESTRRKTLGGNKRYVHVLTRESLQNFDYPHNAILNLQYTSGGGNVTTDSLWRWPLWVVQS